MSNHESYNMALAEKEMGEIQTMYSDTAIQKQRKS